MQLTQIVSTAQVASRLARYAIIAGARVQGGAVHEKDAVRVGGEVGVVVTAVIGVASRLRKSRIHKVPIKQFQIYLA